MKLYFQTRQDLRNFTSKSKKKNLKPVDCGAYAPQGKRWAAQVTKTIKNKS